MNTYQKLLRPFLLINCLALLGAFGVSTAKAAGEVDPAFNASVYGSNKGTVQVVKRQPDGKIITVGGNGSNGRIIEKLNANGSADTSFFGAQSTGSARKIVVQPDGKFLIGGTFTQISGSIRGRIARLNADGSLDNTFDPPGGANDQVSDLDLQPDGKVVLAGKFTGLNGNSNIQKIGRLNADGTLDSSFVQKTDGELFAVKIQPDGKILIGGSMSTVGNQFPNAIARLNADGTIDSSFVGLSNTTVWDVNLQTEGKILLGGEFTRIDGVSRVRIARLLNNLTPRTKLFDYDGDGKADIAVFRPSTGVWYLQRSTAGFTALQFGVSTDVPTGNAFVP